MLAYYLKDGRDNVSRMHGRYRLYTNVGAVITVFNNNPVYEIKIAVDYISPTDRRNRVYSVEPDVTYQTPGARRFSKYMAATAARHPAGA